MQSYEKEQERLRKYWQEILSGEESSDNESLFGDVHLSDEYQPSTSSDGSDSASEYESRAVESAQEQNRKRKRATVNTIDVSTKSVEQAVPSNSKEQEDPNLGDSVDEVIDFVIAQNTNDFEEETLEEDALVANAMNAAIVWGTVNGDNLHIHI